MTASRSIRVAFCLIALGPSADAAELLHPIFTDHAVLQRDRPIEVWGTANPGERIAVTLDRARVETTTNASGGWIATLSALSAGGPHTIAVSSTSATQTVRDVLIGDVWLCSGQSNMVLPVNRALDARSEIANAQNDSIRLLTIPQASTVSLMIKVRSDTDTFTFAHQFSPAGLLSSVAFPVIEVLE